jgi:hypothetical protein
MKEAPLDPVLFCFGLGGYFWGFGNLFGSVALALV